MTTSKAKYSKAQEARMVEVYDGSTEVTSKATVEELMEELNQPKRSIIAKLSSLKVYVSQSGYKTKTGATPTRKAELVQMIATRGNLDFEIVKTLEGASKNALLAVFSAIPENVAETA